MEKIVGKLGFKLVTLAALGYYLAYIGSYTSIMLLIGFALLIENNKTLNFHLTQAILLMFVFDVFKSAWRFLHTLMLDILKWEIFNTEWDTFNSLTKFDGNLLKAVNYVFAFFIILAVYKLFTSKDVKVPIFGNIAEKIWK